MRIYSDAMIIYCTGLALFIVFIYNFYKNN